MFRLVMFIFFVTLLGCSDDTKSDDTTNVECAQSMRVQCICPGNAIGSRCDVSGAGCECLDLSFCANCQTNEDCGSTLSCFSGVCVESLTATGCLGAPCASSSECAGSGALRCADGQCQLQPTFVAMTGGETLSLNDALAHVCSASRLGKVTQSS